MERESRYRPSPTDTLLMDLIAGESEVWHNAVEEYSGFIFAVVKRTYMSYGFKTSHHDIEDTVADVWKNLIENDMKVIKKCMENGNFLPTLHVIAKNRSIDRIRKKNRHNHKLNEYYGVLSSERHDGGLDFDSEALLKAIEQLPPKPRSMVRLFFLQRKKYREIAALTGIPQNSIGPTLARAVSQLKVIMGKKNF